MCQGHFKRGEHQAKCEALLSWPHNLIRTRNGSSVYYQGCQNRPQLHCCQHQHHWLTSSSLQSSSSPESRFHPPGRSLLHRQPTGNQAGSHMWSEKMVVSCLHRRWCWRLCWPFSYLASKGHAVALLHPMDYVLQQRSQVVQKKCNKETQIFQDGSQPLAK